jgi:toluene monooxygenase system protein E
LVTYQWEEAFIALNLVIKPMIDALFLVQLARLAEHAHDDVLAKILLALEDDAKWQREWTQKLVQHCIGAAADNEHVLFLHLTKWKPLCNAALEQLSEYFNQSVATVRTAVRQTCEDLWCESGLSSLHSSV